MPPAPDPTAEADPHHPLHPSPRTAPGPREPELGLPAPARRTARPRSERGSLHRLGNPAGSRHPARPGAGLPYMGRLPALPGRRPIGPRLPGDRHPDRGAAVHLRGDRARRPAHPGPGRDASHRGLDDTGGEKPRHGSGHTRASPTPAHCSPCPHQSPIQTRSPDSTYENATDSAASSTSTNMPLDLHGRGWQGQPGPVAAGTTRWPVCGLLTGGRPGTPRAPSWTSDRSRPPSPRPDRSARRRARR
jgi:hypothetical protein